MAIKGRSRRRSRAKAPALGPRPHVPPRRTPLYAGRRFRRGVAAAVVLAAILGGLRVWQNVSRSHALRAYSVVLLRAQDPLLQHLRPEAVTSFSDLPLSFQRGEVTETQFRQAAGLWERDFKTARDRVVALEPPGPLVEANGIIARAIDMYVGIARLYVPAAIQADLAKRETDPKLRAELEDQVTVLMAHAQEWRMRADETYDIGQEQVDRLRERWLGEPPIPRPTPGIPAFPGDQPAIP